MPDTRILKPLLVFVHIPKTAGSTLTRILSVHEPLGRTQQAGNVFKGAGGLKRGVTFENLRKRSGPGLEGVGAVAGHFPLGLRQHLPGDRELRCFTFLREPTDRTLSHYFAIRENRASSTQRGKYALSALPPDPTLDDALAAGYVHDNLQTRMLSGDPEPFGAATEDMLERAKRNLTDELVFFGLTERFDESLVLARRRLGLRSILYRASRRVNSERPRGGEVPAELRRTAERCNRYDIELYEYAKELFESELEPRDLEFEVELAALRAAKVDGDLEVKAPVPASFGGDQEAWRMLVEARGMILRYEQAAAEIKAGLWELLERAQEAQSQLAEMT